MTSSSHSHKCFNLVSAIRTDNQFRSVTLVLARLANSCFFLSAEDKRNSVWLRRRLFDRLILTSSDAAQTELRNASLTFEHLCLIVSQSARKQVLHAAAFQQRQEA